MNYLWNFSSLISLVYTLQLVSSILLSLRYFASVGTSPFTSVEVIIREVDMSFIVRSIHLVSSQAILLLIYIHILRSLYYSRSANIPISLQSAVILLITISAAFLGYVLPWSQISFWSATVITSFLSVLPYSQDILEWVWSGFTVGHPTLTRFFSLHYLLGLVIAPLSLMHILILHLQSSSSPISDRNDYYIPFWPYFSVNDSWPAALVFCIIITLTLFLIPETENLNNANPIVTPTHINPEWYFLIFYAILRAVPSNVSSLLLILLSIVALVILLVSSNNISLSPLSNFMCSTFLVICLLLSVLSSNPVEEPFLTVSSLLSLTYFSIAFTMVVV